MLDVSLLALSPVDGRYEGEISDLREYFSEFAYLRARVELELRYLSTLSETGLCPPLNKSSLPPGLESLSLQDAREIKEKEKSTRHDVKAIEHFLREQLPADYHPFIHFGLTSEDINNIAQAQALKLSRDLVLLPAMDVLLDSLRAFAAAHRAVPMLGRTHGQPAVPTTLGKEFAVFLARLEACRTEAAYHRFEAKLTGAVGNFNSLHTAAPQVDWISFSRDFIRDLGLEPNMVTNQILPYDNWLRYFDSLRRANTVLTGLAQDLWAYIGFGYLILAQVEGEVGSSTMPQKINPIDFENAEGNLGIANALLSHYGQKLPISRLQRDLSDSTVRRTFGTALGHTLLAWKGIARGLSRIQPDEGAIRSDLDAHWEVVAEGAQTILRAAGHSEAYESLMALTQGRVLTEMEFRSWVETVEVDETVRSKLLDLSPETYIGLAVQITEAVLGGESGDQS